MAVGETIAVITSVADTVFDNGVRDNKSVHIVVISESCCCYCNLYINPVITSWGKLQR